MGRHIYTITVIDDNEVKDTIIATSGRDAFEKLTIKYPEKMTMPFSTFNTYYLKHRKGPFFTVTTSEYTKKTGAQLSKEFRERHKKFIQKQSEEIEQLRNQLIQ